MKLFAGGYKRRKQRPVPQLLLTVAMAGLVVAAPMAARAGATSLGPPPPNPGGPGVNLNATGFSDIVVDSHLHVVFVAEPLAGKVVALSYQEQILDEVSLP